MCINNNIYYAHSKIIYGTQQELEEYGFLKKKFPKATIICPHNTVGELRDSKDYLYVVDCCSKVIVSELNGFIGLGVFAEVARALSNNTSVFVLREKSEEFCLWKVSGIEIINEGSWKNNYGTLIVKQQ
jgi:hypothetical protein